MKKNIGKKFHLMAMLASLTLVCLGGVTACSNGSDSGEDGGNDDKGGDTNGDKITLVENFSLSEITIAEPGVTVAKGEVFADLEESDKVTITITYNNSATKLDEWETWYCYTIDGENWKGDFEKTGGETSVTITGKDITTLKSGTLTIYGNNPDAKVTVTTDKKADESAGNDEALDEGDKKDDDGDGDKKNEVTDEGDKNNSNDTTDKEENKDVQPTTLPTAVILNNKIDGSSWTETAMKKSATDGIWTCELTVSNQYPNFNVKATFGENDVLYKGGEVKLAESGTITKDGSNDIWCDIGKECNGAKISVTVDFTGKEPSIKITLDEKGTEITSTTLPTKVTLIDFVSNDYDNTKRETVMTKSETSAIWTCELETQSDWQNFNVVAIVEEQEIWYNGNAEVTLDTPFDLTSNSEAVWCNVGNGKIAVTVDFTGTAPTIKIKSANEE